MTSTEHGGQAAIGEISAESGLSVHTLRYYERIGLIEPVERASSGHRRYSKDTIEKIEALSYLRASGMSVDDMRTYLANLKLGDAAAADHAALLDAHARKLQEEIELLQVRHGYIESKAAFWKATAEQGRDSAEAQTHIARAREFSERLR